MPQSIGPSAASLWTSPAVPARVPGADVRIVSSGVARCDRLPHSSLTGCLTAGGGGGLPSYAPLPAFW